jgi:hypothetical protein
MSEPTAQEEPGMTWLGPLIVAVGLSLVGLLVWVAVPPGIWHDDGAYLLLGKSLADGEGL